ncbi:MAG: hypothetical protein U1E27_10345 [Kiritimatiellia bacterium]|nr:hypothetical protein [Kiritimatiellia bacterium]
MRGGFAKVGIVLCLACWMSTNESIAQSKREGKSLPDKDSAFFVTTAGEEVTFSWMTQTNRTYIILAADRAITPQQWMELPGMSKVIGTGQEVTLRLRIPNAQQYRFSLRTFAPPPRSPWWRRP